MIKLKNDETALHITILLLCLFPLIISFLLYTDGNSIAVGFKAPIFEVRLPCLFRTVTDYNCPTCGMTRTFTFMSRMDLTDAWNMNRAGVLLYFFCILQIPYRFACLFVENIPYKRVLVRVGYFLLGIIIIVMLHQFLGQFFSFYAKFSYTF